MGQETKEPYITAFRNCFWMTALLFAKYIPLIQNTDLLEMVSQKARRTQNCLARQLQKGGMNNPGRWALVGLE